MYLGENSSSMKGWALGMTGFIAQTANAESPSLTPVISGAMYLYGYAAYTQQCGTHANEDVYTGFAVIDATGAAHTLGAEPIYMDQYGCWPTTETVTTQDGSGYTAHLETAAGSSGSVVYDRMGNSSFAGNLTDPDNISMSIVPPYKDTLGDSD
jgi:hypothetical protein